MLLLLDEKETPTKEAGSGDSSLSIAPLLQYLLRSGRGRGSYRGAREARRYGDIRYYHNTSNNPTHPLLPSWLSVFGGLPISDKTQKTSDFENFNFNNILALAAA